MAKIGVCFIAGLVKHCEIRVSKNRPEKSIETCFEEIRIQLEDGSADYVSLNDISEELAYLSYLIHKQAVLQMFYNRKICFLKCLKEMKKSCF